jgi:thiol:disulfide interchange protein DsbD
VKYLLLGLFFLAFNLAAEFSIAGSDDELVKLRAAFQPPAETSSTGEALLNINLETAQGYHTYVDMLKLTWVSPQNTIATVIDVQPAHSFLDPFSHRERDVVEGHATLKAKVHFESVAKIIGTETGESETAGLAIGGTPTTALFNLTYQICSAKKCLLPKTVSLTAPIKILTTVTGAAAATGGTLGAASVDHANHIEPNSHGDRSEPTAPIAALDHFETALSKGRFWAFIFVFIGGFLTSLTPCVFPMIPITISIIGARSSKNKKSRSFALSLAYVLGIAFTYSTLGVVAASTGAVFGSALANIYVASSVALVFFIMSLSMFGLFDIQVPQKLRNRFGNTATGTGFTGAFVTGLFSGIVASPCIGPVLVSILTYVAKTAEIFLGFALLFTFALGMGLIFIVLGTFTGLLARLPKSGAWLNSTKYIFGTILLLMSFYYALPVFNSLKAKTTNANFSGHPATSVGPVNSAGAGNSASGKNPSNAQNSLAGHKHGGGQGLTWENYDEKLVDQAKQLRMPVIIDFSADWCIACHELEKYTYSAPDVVTQAQAFTLIKVDATNLTPPIQNILSKYKVLGLPTVIFIDRSGHVRSELTILGFVKSGTFISAMKKALN